jgi:hypothetical protein
MKKSIVVVLALAFSMGAHANGFMCKDYTDNVVDINAATPEAGTFTDDPVKGLVTHIRSNPDGYTVVQNDRFKKDLKFSSERFKELGNFAASKTGMIFKKTDGNGNPYFIVLTTPKDEKPGEKPSSNPINRMVTLGNCSEK